MTNIKRRAFLRSAAASLAAGTAACQSMGTAASQAAELAEHQEESGGDMSDVRLQAMTMERIDTHSHWQSKQADLKDTARGLTDFTRSAGMSLSRQLALGSEKLYGITPGLFLRPDSP